MNIEQIVKATLGADAFWSVNKALARRIGIEEAALLAEIIGKHSYWKARGGLDDQGGFFMTSNDIQEVMGIGEKPVGRLTKSILDQGVVRIVKRGVPAKNYWYPQWEFIFSIFSSDPQTGVTSGTLFGVASDTHKGVAITKNTDEKSKTKKIADGKAATPALSRRISDLIGEAHKHLTGEELVWNGHAAKYGKAIKTILETVGKKTDDEAYQIIREKCAAYVLAARTDEFLKKQGVTPVSVLSSWNKVHYKAKAGQSGLGKKKFPDYRSMSVDEIKAAFAKWNKHFTVLDLKANINPESYERFVSEANGFAPALVDILIQEVEASKKTA